MAGEAAATGDENAPAAHFRGNTHLRFAARVRPKDRSAHRSGSRPIPSPSVGRHSRLAVVAYALLGFSNLLDRRPSGRSMASSLLQWEPPTGPSELLSIYTDCPAKLVHNWRQTVQLSTV